MTFQFSYEKIATLTGIEPRNLRELTRRGAINPKGRGEARQWSGVTIARLALAGTLNKVARTDLPTSFRIAVTLVWDGAHDPAAMPAGYLPSPRGGRPDAWKRSPMYLRIYDGQFVCVPGQVDANKSPASWGVVARVLDDGGLQVQTEGWARAFQFRQNDNSITTDHEYAFRRLKGFHESTSKRFIIPTWEDACSSEFLRVEYSDYDVSGEAPSVRLDQHWKEDAFVHVPVEKILARVDGALATEEQGGGDV